MAPMRIGYETVYMSTIDGFLKRLPPNRPLPVKVGKLKKLCFLSSPFSSLLLIFPSLVPFQCDFRPFLYRTQKNLPFGPFPLKWLQIWRGSFSKIRLHVQLFILCLVRLNEIIVSYYSILYHYGYITQLGTIVIVPIPGCQKLFVRGFRFRQDFIVLRASSPFVASALGRRSVGPRPTPKYPATAWPNWSRTVCRPLSQYMYQSVVVLYYSCTIGLAFLLFAGHTDSSLSQYFLCNQY